MATCALCGGRDAATFTVLEYRVSVPACLECLAEAPIEPPAISYTQRVRAAVGRFDGVTLAELAEVLGYDHRDRKQSSHTSQVLTRLCRAGDVVAIGERNAREYHLAAKLRKTAAVRRETAGARA